MYYIAQKYNLCCDVHISYHSKAQICVAVCSLSAGGEVTKPLQFVALPLPEAAKRHNRPIHAKPSCDDEDVI